MHVLYVLTSIMFLLGNIRAECPHIRTGLLKWSSSETWGSEGKPTEGQNVEISQNLLLDETPPSLNNITIKAGGSLIFNPEVEMEVRARNILVQGTLEIGSEDCPYNGSLTITLTGNRKDHLNRSEAKVLLVEAGGTLEIHGEPRRSWTKLNKTLLRPQDTNDVYFDHQLREEYKNFTSSGIIAYTLKVVGSDVTVIKSGLYFLRTESRALADQINAVEDGQVLMMAGQEKILSRSGDKHATAYEAIETLVYGNITGTGILRSVSQEGDTWAFIYKKGTPSSYREVTQPFGTTSSVQFIESDDALFTVESVGAEDTNEQTVTFLVMNINATTQLLHMMDDVTTWRPGDKIVIASTDYDWGQAEKREIVLCPECNNYQIRIDKPVRFVHYGKVIYNAIDMRAEVMLLSRKVVIRGEMEPTCPEFNGNCDIKQVQEKDTFGANTKFVNGFKNVHIENIEIYNAGQQTDLGRYPFHFHMCFNSGESVPYIKGCSIHDTFARCVTIHGTHGILVMDNACYNHMGHGYYLEDGGEQNNTIDGNLAMTTRTGTGALEPSDSDKPAGFWITNPLNYVRNNVAAGGEGLGLWVIFPAEPFPPSRQYHLMAPLLARSTNMLEFTNNLAHSNEGVGIKVGGRLLDKRIVNCCNLWEPLADPTNRKSPHLVVNFSHLTGYKNSKFNVWLEGSFLNLTRVSVADSENGIINSNERNLRQAGWIGYSVIVGDSENVGLPDEEHNYIGRSLPQHAKSYKPHSGISMWRGPVQYHHLWFDGFTNNGLYDNAAIAKKRADRYYFSVTNNYKDILYAFDDKDGVANLAISGDKNTTGWSNSKDAEQVAGFTWYRNTENGRERWYVVKPDPLSSAGADCRLRPHWRLAMCKTKYGNFRVDGGFFGLGAVGVYVLDDYPGAQLEFVLEKSGGPQTPVDGSRTYTFHTVGQVPPDMEFVAEGVETGDVLRIGACVPSGVEWTLEMKFPYKLETTADFIKVDSLAELDAKEPERDGKKYFFDNSTGMLYYKFIGHTVRAENDNQICGGGICPSFFIHLIGNLTGVNGDCRQTLYGSRLSDLPPALPTITETFKANSGPNPPEGYGHGPQRPYSSRSPVKGRYGPWSKWSACSTTCGNGVKYMTRECNNPLPEHGWNFCTAKRIRTTTCSLGPCE